VVLLIATGDGSQLYGAAVPPKGRVSPVPDAHRSIWMHHPGLKLMHTFAMTRVRLITPPLPPTCPSRPAAAVAGALTTSSAAGAAEAAAATAAATAAASGATAGSTVEAGKAVHVDAAGGTGAGEGKATDVSTTPGGHASSTTAPSSTAVAVASTQAGKPPHESEGGHHHKQGGCNCCRWVGLLSCPTWLLPPDLVL
jgi:hypothetical protein